MPDDFDDSGWDETENDEESPRHNEGLDWASAMYLDHTDEARNATRNSSNAVRDAVEDMLALISIVNPLRDCDSDCETRGRCAGHRHLCIHPEHYNGLNLRAAAARQRNAQDQGTGRSLWGETMYVPFELRKPNGSLVSPSALPQIDVFRNHDLWVPPLRPYIISSLMGRFLAQYHVTRENGHNAGDHLQLVARAYVEGTTVSCEIWNGEVVGEARRESSPREFLCIDCGRMFVPENPARDGLAVCAACAARRIHEQGRANEAKREQQKPAPLFDLSDAPRRFLGEKP